ncbi:unnamed protein product [Closterium sp. NIES-64]|nr:unnamed protein product [Closterium sp. NIES-64]
MRPSYNSVRFAAVGYGEGASRGWLLTDGEHGQTGVALQSSFEQSLSAPGDSGDAKIPLLFEVTPLPRKLQQQGQHIPALRQISREMLTTLKQQQQRKQQRPKTQKIGSDTGKKSWPEVVGMTGEAARKKIKASVPPNWTVGIVLSGFMMTSDFRDDRVLIYVDKAGIVQRIPTVG